MHLRALLAGAAALAVSVASHAQSGQGMAGCNSAGLKLPQGFCASVFADDIGRARHLTVSGDGVVYVNTWSGRYYGSRPPRTGGFVVALQDTHGSGRADVVRRFGMTPATGGHGGTGIALYKGFVYVEESERIERYALKPGSIVPQGKPEVIVSRLPLSGDHPMHPFVIDASGALYVDVASATNSCQQRNRERESKGIDPCTELETRAGIWRFDANRPGQEFSSRERYATGIRNAEGLAVDASGEGIWSTQHGRDQLYQNWPKLYQPEQEATQPAEELLKVISGGDYGWPECYYDEIQRRLVLAPEYGGDGGKAVGVCAQKLAPVASFPAHWAPNDAVIYTGKSFPARYHGGAFIAFHGSWDRAPYPQGGYNVVFQPLSADQATSRCEIFADGFAGRVKEPGSAAHRPSGVAVAPDGALFVADDQRGRIYRISWQGGGDAAPAGTACPPPDTPAGAKGEFSAAPPEGTDANAGREAESLPVPPGATRAQVELGAQVFHGKGGATCTSCHGAKGEGTALGPELTAHDWLWSDGSYEGIEQVIQEGVPQPKKFHAPMPPMGGAQLSGEQVSAVAAYVWAISHR
jgi:glucose/arabinose dehydrogenase/cytochrome c5